MLKCDKGTYVCDSSFEFFRYHDFHSECLGFQFIGFGMVFVSMIILHCKMPLVHRRQERNKNFFKDRGVPTPPGGDVPTDLAVRFNTTQDAALFLATLCQIQRNYRKNGLFGISWG